MPKASSRATKLAGWFAAALTALTAAHAASGPGALEYEIKATFVYKFAPFVNWPQAAFASPQSPLTICIAGHDSVTDLIDQAAAGQSANGRAIATRHLPAAHMDADCHILYVANTDPALAGAVLASARKLPVLTVTDASTGDHGIINFVVAENHVRFDIDDNAADRNGLVISSKLLGLAREIVPKSPERTP